MSLHVLIKLVLSLSKSEKRAFKLSTNKQKGTKIYLQLFDLIDKGNYLDCDQLAADFKINFPGFSLETTHRYCRQLILDSLININVNKGEYFKLLYGLMQVQILKERNLVDEAFRTVEHLEKSSLTNVDLSLRYLLKREKLHLLSDAGFESISEEELVEYQFNSLEILRELRNTHEHNSLYESLKFRYINQANFNSKKVDDLVLSELSIVNARVKHNFESQKVHLLFQSFFFMHTGHYKSALKTFYDLNGLFETHLHKLKHPPFDYFSMLDGILDSLRSMKTNTEMGYFLDKLKQLNNEKYPDHFKFLVRKTIVIYQLHLLIQNKEYDLAKKFIQELNKETITEYSMVDSEKQNELYFYIALLWFNREDYKKAMKFINKVVLIKKSKKLNLIFRVCKLLSIILRYEEKDFDYLDYDIRAYKRSFDANQKMSLVEKLIIHTVQLKPFLNTTVKNSMTWEKKFLPIIKQINNDNNEISILKYYPFVEWSRSKFLPD